MSTYTIIVTTQDRETRDDLVSKLTSLAVDGKFEIDQIVLPDDPTKEPGNYIMWYHSESHHKDRYYVGPPTLEYPKVHWTYNKKEATKLSKKACEILADLVGKMGYKTPMTIELGSAKLSVVKDD